MDITYSEVTVRELVDGYREDDETNSVIAMGGRLVVRPEYQRQFVYEGKDAAAVVNTIMRGFPLGIMYFANLDDQNGAQFEVLDGQQRIISICRYAQQKSAISVKVPTPTGGFNYVNFANLSHEHQEAILDYRMKVYVCTGTDKEKLDWFEVINIAGKKLEKQELKSAIYHGPWVTDAKSLFVRKGCAAQKNWAEYLSGDQDRQKWLETILRWAADADGLSGKNAIDQYMQTHRFDNNADELWNYFERVMRWTTATFDIYRTQMAQVDWGILYNRFGKIHYDSKDMEKRIATLMEDEEITKPAGIYAYVLDGDERNLSLRQFIKKEKRIMFERQGHRCPLCGPEKEYSIGKMAADHIIPWSQGGKTVIADVDDPLKPNNTQNGNNGQMLCTIHNLQKSNK